MRLNRKGFTLVELLVTIIIIALVVGLSIYGIITVVSSSKGKAIILSVDNLKDAARVYSAEMGSASWKKTKYDYDAFCVTVGELMNKGLLDKNAEIEEKDINKSTFIIVKRNNITLSIEKEEIVSSNTNDENNSVCTGQINVPGEKIVEPEIGASASYTDKIVINFTPGSATYQGNPSETTYKCLYGVASSSINMEGKIIGNTCELDNLKNNTDYYVIIYMNTNHGSSIAASGENNYKTTDFKEPDLSQNGNKITITYYDTDTNENIISPVYHYFKSTVDGVSDVNVKECEYKNNIYTCSGSTKTIESDTWYKLSETNVVITYPEEDNDIIVSARIYDGSNNYIEKKSDFAIKKYIIKFYRNGAASIDGGTNVYVEKYCIASGNSTCTITSPSFTSPTGYSVVGYGTSASSSTSSWNVNTTKSISTSTNYYAIIKANTYTVTYNSSDLIYGRGNVSSTLAPGNNGNLTFSISSNVVTASGGSSDSYGFIPYRVYLEAGNTYIFSCTTDGTWGASTSSDTVEVYLMLDGKYDTFLRMNSNVNYEFTPTVTGEYWLRVDINYAGKTHTFSNIKISQNISTSSVIYKQSYGAMPTPTRIGYTFNGWYTSASGGTEITSTTTVTTASDHTLYAHWTANTYTITFDVNGGDTFTSSKCTGTGVSYSSSTSTCTKVVTYNSTYGTLPTPTRSGYTFTGWFTSATGGTKVTSSSSVSITANQTLYAHWLRATCSSDNYSWNNTIGKVDIEATGNDFKYIYYKLYSATSYSKTTSSNYTIEAQNYMFSYYVSDSYDVLTNASLCYSKYDNLKPYTPYITNITTTSTNIKSITYTCSDDSTTLTSDRTCSITAKVIDSSLLQPDYDTLIIYYFSSDQASTDITGCSGINHYTMQYTYNDDTTCTYKLVYDGNDWVVDGTQCINSNVRSKTATATDKTGNVSNKLIFTTEWQ